MVSVAGMHGQFYVNDIMVANPSASVGSVPATSTELGTGDIIAMVVIGIMAIAGIMVVITLARQI